VKLHDVKPAPGSTKKRIRAGRGIAAGRGKTAGYGTKGQTSRSGGNIPAWFEGGQTPIHRRLPVKKGFKNINHKEYAIVNLDDLEKFENGQEITPELLQAGGLIHAGLDGVKILAFGALTKKLTVKAHKFSKKAAEAIAACGGEAVTL